MAPSFESTLPSLFASTCLRRARLMVCLRSRRCRTFAMSPLLIRARRFSDSFTLAIAHREPDGAFVLDCFRETRAPFQPEAVVADFCKTLTSYRVGRVHGDRYAGEWPREQFKKRNVDYVPSERVKIDIYRDCLPLLNSRQGSTCSITAGSYRSCTALSAGRRAAARIRLITDPARMMTLRMRLRVRLFLASAPRVPLNFHAPIIGPGRSAWIEAAAFWARLVRGLPMPRCRLAVGRPGVRQAGGLDAPFGWSIKQKN